MEQFVKPPESVDECYLTSLEASVTSYDVFRVLKRISFDFGYKYFMALKLPVNESERMLDSLAILTNWDPELIRAYDAKELAAASPIFKILKESVTPIVWDVRAINVERADKKQREVVEMFESFGHYNGVHMPTSDRRGKRGAIGFSGNREPLTQDELGRLSLYSTHAYDRLCRIAESTEKTTLSLTQRELDCLIWTAAGKTSNETALILEISENTVNHYLSSAANKLNTTNKAHTVAKAIRMGLLDD